MAAAAVLHEDCRGIPRSLPLFAALVEAESRGYAAAASRPAGSDLVRAFRGGAAPTVSVREFLEQIHLFVRSRDTSCSRGIIRMDGTCFVLAGIYLTRFLRSPAAREARVLVEPTTAHRLAAVALFVGTKFGGHAPSKWTAVFEHLSGHTILAAEMSSLEDRFLQAIGFRLFVATEEFTSFCRVLQEGHRWQADATAGKLAPIPEHEPLTPRGSCASSKKRPADSAAEVDRRSVRSRSAAPPPAIVSK